MDGHQTYAVASLFEDRRLGSLRGCRTRVQRFHESTERHASFKLVLPCKLRNVKHVRKGLFAAGTEDEGHMGACVVEQRDHRVRRGAAVPRRVDNRELLQGITDRLEV